MTITVRQSRITVAILFLAALTASTSAMAISPLLPAIADEFGVSIARAGQLGTVAAIMAMLVALVALPFMDRASRVNWLRAQAAVLMLATLVAVLAPSFGWLAAGRILGGLGGAVVVANCLSALGDFFPDPARRNRALGIIVSAVTTAILVGLPAIAQIEDAAGWRWAFGSLLLPLGLVFASTWLLPSEPRLRTRAAGESVVARYRRVLGHRPTVWLMTTMALIVLVYMGWLTYFGAYVEDDLGRGARTLGALFLAAGALELVANNLAPAALARWSVPRIFAAAMIVWTVPMLLTGILVERLWTVFVAVAAINVGAAILYFVVNALLLDSLPSERGAVMALNSASINLGATLGATGGGLALTLFDSYGTVYRLLGLILPVALVTLYGSRGRRSATEVVVLEPA
ncbi:MAG: MFS transporter [Thermomicrobiales bacterium]